MEFLSDGIKNLININNLNLDLTCNPYIGDNGINFLSSGIKNLVNINYLNLNLSENFSIGDNGI